MPTLAQLQQSFAEAILAPEPISAPDGLQYAERMLAYRESFWERIDRSLSDDFPRFWKLLNEERQRELAGHFFRHANDREHSLYELSRKFPNYLATQNFEDLPPFAVDLARWEWAEIESFLRRELPRPLEAISQEETQKITLRLNTSAHRLTLHHDIIAGDAPFHELPHPTKVMLWHAPYLYWKIVSPLLEEICCLLNQTLTLQEFLAALEDRQGEESAEEIQSSISESISTGLIVLNHNK